MLSLPAFSSKTRSLFSLAVKAAGYRSGNARGNVGGRFSRQMSRLTQPSLGGRWSRLIVLMALVSIALTWTFISSSLTINQAAAQQQITLTAIPPRLGDDNSLRIKPGEKIQTSIKVRNAAYQPLQVQSIAQDFIIDEDGQTPIPVTDQVSNRWSLASWIVLTPPVQTLQPNQIGQINVIIEVPADALPGGHYAMITHQPLLGVAGDQATSIISAQSASQINQRVGTLIYVVVDGPINEEAFIRGFEFPRFTEYGPVPFSFQVDNQSDVHISPRTTVDIVNLFGQRVDQIQLEPKNIFPFTSRRFNGQWDRVWGMGWYQARLVMSFGGTGQIVTDTTTFWLLPITLLFGILVIMLTALVIFIAIRRHWLHRQNLDRRRVEILEKKLAELERDQTSDPNEFNR